MIIMSRDYTKYLVNNNSTPLSKRALALEVVRSYNTDKKPTFDKIKEIFPDEVQGSKGFIRKKSEKYDLKRFHEEALISSDNVQYLVSNQWGSKNISGLLKKGEILGIQIKEFNKSENQKSENSSSSSKLDKIKKTENSNPIKDVKPNLRQNKVVEKESTLEKENKDFINKFWKYIRPKNLRNISVDDVISITSVDAPVYIAIDLPEYVKKNDKIELDVFQKVYIDDTINVYHLRWKSVKKNAQNKKLPINSQNLYMDETLKSKFLRDGAKEFLKEFKKLRKKYKK